MRIAVFSDVHGNLEAMQAVIADAGAVDQWWCLGDMVGYGADPNACMDLLRSLPHEVLPGNHDLGALGELDLAHFNDDAATCLEWTARTLRPEHAAFLRGLPARLERGDFTLVHASPRDPVWEYVLSPRQARANADYFTTRFCLVGHTHQPAAFDEHGGTDFAGADAAYAGTDARRFLLNPGGVGQPRDGDPRAGYMLLEEEARHLEWRRVAYDVEKAAARILAEGLPEIEALRLHMGR